MATTRKRARTDAAQDLPLSVDSLASFMGVEQPDIARLGLALGLAKEAALAFTGRAIRDAEPHPIRHGVHMLASQLLIKNQLDAAPSGVEIPAVVRYLWKSAA